jgi:hypothetical protein
MSEEGESDGGWATGGWIHGVTDFVASAGASALETAEVAGAPMLGALGTVLGPAGVALGLHELGEGTDHGDVEKIAAGGLETLGGVAGTTEGVATILGAAGVEGAAGVAAAAAPIAAVAGAGALGLAAGTEMGNIADGESTRTGLWGTDGDTGQNKSAMDWGAGWGTSVDEALGNDEPSVLGGIAAGAGGIVGGVAGTVQSGVDAVLSW